MSTLNKNVSSFQIWNSSSSYYTNFYWQAAGYGTITQPSNTGAQLYFKVSNAVQNLQVINVGEITTALALKTDAEQAAHAAMPSTQYDDLAAVSGQQYIAVADGYFVLEIRTKGIGQIGMVNKSVEPASVKVSCVSSTAAQNLSCFIPAAKGQNVEIYVSNADVVTFGFVYAQGAA